MRNKMLILIPIVLLVLALVGCNFPFIPGPEPEEPVSEMEAVAIAELVKVDAVYGEDGDGEEIIITEAYWTIAWSIVNTGDVFIREYTLIFLVNYPDISKDHLIIELTKPYLEVGTMHSGDITLAPYGKAEPKSVSVKWELSE